MVYAAAIFGVHPRRSRREVSLTTSDPLRQVHESLRSFLREGASPCDVNLVCSPFVGPRKLHLPRLPHLVRLAVVPQNRQRLGLVSAEGVGSAPVLVLANSKVTAGRSVGCFAALHILHGSSCLGLLFRCPLSLMMTSATAATITQGRKRRRRQLGLAAADGVLSPTPGTFPRVATAPANFAASSTSTTTAGTVKAGTPAKTRRSSPVAFGDTSELESQIATLALIRAYGYGTVPGTPLRRGSTSSPGAGRRARTTLHGERNRGFVKSSEVKGGCIPDCGAPTTVGKIDRTEHQASARSRRGATRANREPWIGPLDVGVGPTHQK